MFVLVRASILNPLPLRSPLYILTITCAGETGAFSGLKGGSEPLGCQGKTSWVTLWPGRNNKNTTTKKQVRKTRGETELTVLFNRKQIALHFSVTQIAAHLCLSGFVGNNWEEVVGSQTGIGFRPRRPSCCSEQAPVVKQFRCGYIRREWKRWLRPKLGLEGMQEGWVNCRGELGGWITVLFGFTERNSKRKSLFTLASSD